MTTRLKQLELRGHENKLMTAYAKNYQESDTTARIPADQCQVVVLVAILDTTSVKVQ